MKLQMALQFPIKIVSADIVPEPLIDPLVLAVRTSCFPDGMDQRSNIGDAWRSSLDVHKQPNMPLAFEPVMERVRSFTAQCVHALTEDGEPSIEECWINILRPGAYNAMHDHLPFDWSGILWLDAENKEDGYPHGCVEFNPPFPGRMFGTDGSLHVKPINGVAVFFPAGLKHMVHPVRTGNRIAMAWNVRLGRKS